MEHERYSLTLTELRQLAGLLQELARADPAGAAAQTARALDLADRLDLLSEDDPGSTGSPYRDQAPPTEPLSRAQWLEINEFAARFFSDPGRLRVLKLIERPEAQTAIYAMATEIAREAHVTPREAAVLSWLEEAWGLS